MVNSSNPSKDCVTIRSYYSLHEASRKPNHRWSTLPPATFTGKIFQQPPFRPKSTPTGAPPSDLPSGGSLAGAPTRDDACNTVFTHARQQVHPSCPAVAEKSPSFLVFLSGHCYCVFLLPESPLFLCFLELYDIFRTLGVVFVNSY